MMPANSLVYVLVAYVMKYQGQYQPDPETYENLQAMRVFQYCMYFSGLAVFFFSDFIVGFFRKAYWKKNDNSNDVNPAYKFSLTMLEVMDYTGLCGLIGFFVSGNVTWVVVFCAISFFSKLRFLPTERNLARFHRQEG